MVFKDKQLVFKSAAIVTVPLYEMSIKTISWHNIGGFRGEVAGVANPIPSRQHIFTKKNICKFRPSGYNPLPKSSNQWKLLSLTKYLGSPVYKMALDFKGTAIKSMRGLNNHLI